jgi:hypothetical protein
MNFSLQIQAGEKVRKLVVNQVSKENEIAVIEGLLNFLDESLTVAEKAPGLSEITLIDAYNAVDLEAAKAERKIEKSLKVAEEKPQEEQPNLDNDQNYWETGIKIDDDGTKRYKCRYWCKCGSKKNRYIKLGTETIKCFDCLIPIDVMPATHNFDGDGVPEQDDFGNFFVAR